MFLTPALKWASSGLVRAYCDRVIKLSANLQTYAIEKEVTSNVNGVRSEFLEQGLRLADHQQQEQQEQLPLVPSVQKQKADSSENDDDDDAIVQTSSVYFIGKMMWAKGLDRLLDLQEYYKKHTGEYFHIDIYGSGPEETAVQRAFLGFYGTDKAKGATTNSIDLIGNATYLPSLERIQEKAREKMKSLKKTVSSVDLTRPFAPLRLHPIPATFPGRVDHAELKNYKIFVNPSVSEVLCTATAEALAMGKFAIVPVHPSNTFFMRFPNTLAYRNKAEFQANLMWAMTHDPVPLTPYLARRFTWEAATDRFIEASAITAGEASERERLGLSRLDDRIAWWYQWIGVGTFGDYLRLLGGGGPVSNQNAYIQEHDVENTRRRGLRRGRTTTT